MAARRFVEAGAQSLVAFFRKKEFARRRTVFCPAPRQALPTFVPPVVCSVGVRWRSKSGQARRFRVRYAM